MLKCSAASRYNQLATERQPFLVRGEEAAKLTLPFLLPPQGHAAADTLPTPYQGIGARGVNNMASKTVLTLFPPNLPFFRLKITEAVKEALESQQIPESQYDEQMARFERDIASEVEVDGLRTPLFEGMRHLIIAGNVLLDMPDAGGARIFPMNSYVVKRDPFGNLMECVLREQVHPDTLPDDVRELVPKDAATATANSTSAAGSVKQGHVDLYTVLVRQPKGKGGRWVRYQEIGEIAIPGSMSFFPLDEAPMLALRLISIAGEDYGRGYVDEYYGDLYSLEQLTRAIVQGSAAAAKLLILVSPGGLTDLRRVQEADNGATIPGRADDISAFQLNKFNDFQIAQATAKGIEQRLAFAFLMNTAVQRDGERVTAEEIRFMAQEIEDTLGGLYSLLGAELQAPVLRRQMARMRRQGKLPSFPKGSIRPVIITGLDALGRNHEVNRLKAAIADFTALVGPQKAQQALNALEIGKRIFTGYNVDAKGLLATEEEIAEASKQQTSQQALNTVLDKGTAPAINALSAATQAPPQEGAPA